MIQFGTIKFPRTFRNYFGQFVWIEKKRITILVAFHLNEAAAKNDALSIFHQSRQVLILFLGTVVYFHQSRQGFPR